MSLDNSRERNWQYGRSWQMILYLKVHNGRRLRLGAFGGWHPLDDRLDRVTPLDRMHSSVQSSNQYCLYSILILLISKCLSCRIRAMFRMNHFENKKSSLQIVICLQTASCSAPWRRDSNVICIWDVLYGGSLPKLSMAVPSFGSQNTDLSIDICLFSPYLYLFASLVSFSIRLHFYSPNQENGWRVDEHSQRLTAPESLSFVFTHKGKSTFIGSLLFIKVSCLPCHNSHLSNLNLKAAITVKNFSEWRIIVRWCTTALQTTLMGMSFPGFSCTFFSQFVRAVCNLWIFFLLEWLD